MKASEMTNEELAKALMSRVPLDSDRHDDLREAAARLRNLGEIGEAVGRQATREKSSQVGIEAAHKREVAELKHWIKSAARWIKCHDIYHTSGSDLIKQAKEILNDNGEFLFKKGEE